VIKEVGIKPAPYPIIKRRLPTYSKPEWRQAMSGAAAGRAAEG